LERFGKSEQLREVILDLISSGLFIVSSRPSTVITKKAITNFGVPLIAFVIEQTSDFRPINGDLEVAKIL